MNYFFKFLVPFLLVLFLSSCEGTENSANSNYFQKLNEGDFTCEIVKKDSYFVIRYLKNNSVLSRADLLSLLTSVDEKLQSFRLLLNKSIATLPEPKNGNDNYMLHAPLINSHVKNEPFYFVAVENKTGEGIDDTFLDYLANCKSTSNKIRKMSEYTSRFWHIFSLKKDFSVFKVIAQNMKINGLGENAIEENSYNYASDKISEKFLGYGAVVFKGGYPPKINADEIMVSPCPIVKKLSENENKSLGKIYSFSKYLHNNLTPENKRRLHAFWFAVGKAANKMFENDKVKDLDGKIIKNGKLFLNTHGNIKYLHFRIETKARYYTNKIKPFLEDEEKSKVYYEQSFNLKH